MIGGKAAVWLGLVLLCLFSSCSKDEELFPVSIDQLYAESQTLQYQTPEQPLLLLLHTCLFIVLLLFLLLEMSLSRKEPDRAQEST